MPWAIKGDKGRKIDENVMDRLNGDLRIRMTLGREIPLEIGKTRASAISYA